MFFPQGIVSILVYVTSPMSWLSLLLAQTLYNKSCYYDHLKTKKSNAVPLDFLLSMSISFIFMEMLVQVF